MNRFLSFSRAVAIVMAVFVTGPTTAESEKIAQTGCKQAGTFVSVSNYSHNGRYSAPSLSVECSGDNVVVRSNGITNFEFVRSTPHDLEEKNYVWRIPRNPQEASDKKQVPLLGPIGIALNGLPLFGPNESSRHGTGDPYLDGLLDFCGGHTGPGGTYHFHIIPKCLFDKIEGKVSLVVGYAFDGYPILGPYECTDASCTNIKKVRSSWQKVNSDRNVWTGNAYQARSGDLDRCNGMKRPDGSYAYYATEKFPYLLACYHGVAAFNHDVARSGGGRPAGGRFRGPPPDGWHFGAPPGGSGRFHGRPQR